jgi:hypothetical protein
MFKFEIKQLVFCVRRITQSYESCCGFCGGQGHIIGKNNQTADCPSCWGSGKGLKYTKDIFKVYSGIIYERNYEEKIVENIFPDNFKNTILSLITYQIDGIPGNIVEEYIFATEKEANDLAKKLNKNIK